jgi:hypothetical protein
MSATALRRLFGLALLGLATAACAIRDQFDAGALQAWVDSEGTAGPLIFIAIYAAAAVLFLPGAVDTLAGGALFGPVWGTPWNLSGATMGATLAFLIARHLGADWVVQLAVDAEVEEGEFANSALHLQSDAQGPDVLELERRLLPDELALVPRLAMNDFACGTHDGLPSS